MAKMEELRSFALFITALAVWYYNTASWIVNSYQKYYVTEFFYVIQQSN